jgi:serine/threonine protein kinase
MSEPTVLAERYEVLAEIARGGMGRVVRARDRLLDREVAVKLLLGRGKSADRLLARFVEESQVTGQLAHPGIVPVHDLGLHDGEPFLVMKLVRGRTLRELMKDLAGNDGSTRPRRSIAAARRSLEEGDSSTPSRASGRACCACSSRCARRSRSRTTAA